METHKWPRETLKCDGTLISDEYILKGDVEALKGDKKALKFYREAFKGDEKTSEGKTAALNMGSRQEGEGESPKKA